MDKMPMSSLGWGATLAMGLVTLVIGALLVAATTASLAVIAVLLGAVMIVTGIWYVVRALSGREDHERAWRGVCGVVFVLVGLALLRDLSLSIALIGLLIGFTWVIQGVLMLMESFSSARRHARGGGWASGWTMFFGVISLIAGIVVIASPIASVAVLTIFLGIWLIILGAIEIGGSFAPAARCPQGGSRRGNECSSAAPRRGQRGRCQPGHGERYRPGHGEPHGTGRAQRRPWPVGRRLPADEPGLPRLTCTPQ
jgi:uncharacterized membrane protein HdeD (DUF308 family)